MARPDILTIDFPKNLRCVRVDQNFGVIFFVVFPYALADFSDGLDNPSFVVG